VNGTANIAVGDKLSTYSSAGIGAKATAGKGGVFAIALEAYTNSDSSGVIDAILFEPGRFDSTAGGNTLDSSYDQGGQGVGRTITVDTNAVVLAGDEATENIFEITNTAGTGALIALTHTTTPYCLNPEGSTPRLVETPLTHPMTKVDRGWVEP